MVKVFTILKRCGWKSVNLIDAAQYRLVRSAGDNHEYNPIVKSRIIDLLDRNGDDLPPIVVRASSSKEKMKRVANAVNVMLEGKSLQGQDLIYMACILSTIFHL